MELEFKVINCPICGNIYKRCITVYSRNFNVWLDNEQKKWKTKLLACPKCNMVYTNPLPSQDTLEYFYSSDLRYGNQKVETKQKQLDFIFDNSHGIIDTIFDIGSYDGFFLDLARQHGLNVDGIEPSDEEVKNACDRYGIDTYHGFFDSKWVNEFLDEGHPKFDVVTLRHVYEHIPNPVEFVENIKRVVKDHGYIFIEIPNTLNPTLDNLADFFSIQHIMHYTRNSLYNLADKLNLTVVKCECDKKYPVIRLLLQNTSPFAPTVLKKFKTDTKPIIDCFYNYIDIKYKLYADMKEKVKDLDHYYIYGAGQHTSQLLQCGIVDRKKIKGILDSNPKKWDTKFEGLDIMNPDILKYHSTIPNIIISSYDSQDEIYNYLNENYVNIKIIKLYDNPVFYR